MLLYLFFTNWIMSMMFLALNHPLSLGCILLIQSIVISLMSGFLYLNFWYSYILFLIMIGGMLIMFIYMTSIASNEKFKLPKKMIFLLSFSLIILITIIMTTDSYFASTLNNNFMNMEFLNLEKNFSLIKFFNYPNMQILLMLMIYLLISLIAIVKIINKKNSSLRQLS